MGDKRLSGQKWEKLKSEQDSEAQQEYEKQKAARRQEFLNAPGRSNLNALKSKFEANTVPETPEAYNAKMMEENLDITKRFKFEGIALQNYVKDLDLSTRFGKQKLMKAYIKAEEERTHQPVTVEQAIGFLSSVDIRSHATPDQFDPAARYPASPTRTGLGKGELPDVRASPRPEGYAETHLPAGRPGLPPDLWAARRAAQEARAEAEGADARGAPLFGDWSEWEEMAKAAIDEVAEEKRQEELDRPPPPPAPAAEEEAAAAAAAAVPPRHRPAAPVVHRGPVRSAATRVGPAAAAALTPKQRAQWVVMDEPPPSSPGAAAARGPDYSGYTETVLPDNASTVLTPEGQADIAPSYAATFGPVKPVDDKGRPLTQRRTKPGSSPGGGGAAGGGGGGGVAPAAAAPPSPQRPLMHGEILAGGAGGAGAALRPGGGPAADWGGAGGEDDEEEFMLVQDRINRLENKVMAPADTCNLDGCQVM